MGCSVLPACVWCAPALRGEGDDDASGGDSGWALWAVATCARAMRVSEVEPPRPAGSRNGRHRLGSRVAAAGALLLRPVRCSSSGGRGGREACGGPPGSDRGAALQSGRREGT